MEKPGYLFETSWEVCNMVGGIYTVLSTRARTLAEEYGDKLIFIGPDVWKERESPYFIEDKKLLKSWRENFIKNKKLKVRTGRWDIPGKPIAILVDFNPLCEIKDSIYARFWELYRVDSLHGYGDYDEASMFGYASGLVMEHYYSFHKLTLKDDVAAHFNEWMTTFGAFHIHDTVPEIATLFTTHATSIGRSIAGNNKPLYNYLGDYNGDQMAFELNMQAKHSTEKTAAHLVDCFTSVSEITAVECTQLLDKKPHIVTPNGFEDDFVPKGKDLTSKRNAARKVLKNVSETIFGYKLNDNVKFVITAGRYEYKNKGLDVFIEALKTLSYKELNNEVVAFIMVPAHIKGARKDIAEKLNNPNAKVNYWNKRTSHELYDYQNDHVISALRWFHFENLEHENVKIIFVPSYLNGDDGIFNKTYWDLLVGMDLSVFPSYYEPWGYTPLESIAFSIPTITTTLSGFGQWVKSFGKENPAAAVVHRSDYNYHEVSCEIADKIFTLLSGDNKTTNAVRKQARDLSKKALWSEFIQHYYRAYDIALTNRSKRL